MKIIIMGITLQYWSVMGINIDEIIKKGAMKTVDDLFWLEISEENYHQFNQTFTQNPH